MTRLERALNATYLGAMILNVALVYFSWGACRVAQGSNIWFQTLGQGGSAISCVWLIWRGRFK